jgi:hypothetical protein
MNCTHGDTKYNCTPWDRLASALLFGYFKFKFKFDTHCVCLFPHSPNYAGPAGIAAALSS